MIPDFSTTVLIYCNNNFEGSPVDFPTKVVLQPRFLEVRADDESLIALRQSWTAADSSSESESEGTAVAPGPQPLLMALNVPTYINLYGYGYRNIYELDELVNVNDRRVAFEGSTVGN